MWFNYVGLSPDSFLFFLNGSQAILVEMVRGFIVSAPFQIIQMYQAEYANKQAEHANKLSGIANDQQAVIVKLLLGLFSVFFAAFVIYGINMIRRYFIKVRHSVRSTIFIQSYHLLTHFAHFPKQQKLKV
jgi:hypothetical protein